jgi:hypothetical protein
MAPPPDPRKNHLLAMLPDAEWQRWLPQLEWVVKKEYDRLLPERLAT